jgi:Leucine-rich repeat (LRR) protein
LSQNKNLQGPLPYQLVATHPTLSLDLSGCNIQGTIPPRLMHDFNYELLNLSSNALTGTLTATAPNRYIRSLDLSYNQFTGSIPRLVVTQDLILSHNRLTNNLAEIKYSYSILKVLDVSHNELDGELVLDDDDDIRLNYFDISHNRFNSSTLLLKFPALKYCDASNNDFKCPIAIWLTTECNAVCHN